uniref:Polyubiquitin n=1 Tax=Melicertus latisulcatus majanivirus TaxID=2984277 RepID=A0A9C7BVU3_9VIRU|nr:MAG: polyubiquitin [Melicertus latisulcatus majanivirus]
MRIHVVILTSEIKSFTLDVTENDTVHTVKEKIHDQEEIPAHQQRLLFDGIPLKDDDMLKDYNVQEQDKIFLYKM